MIHYNIFRLLGDQCHLLAILILLFRIHKKGSCAGISGKSQILFTLVFTARYADLMTQYVDMYNSAMKVIFLVTSYYTLYLIFYRYKGTYEKTSDSFRYEVLILISGSLGILYHYHHNITNLPLEILWTCSIYLEAIAIIPQLYMFYQTKDVSMFPGYYVFALGLYRALYILNWIWRYYDEDYLDPISVGGGVIQTFLYLDFFYMVYKHNTKDNDQLKTLIV